MRKTFPLRQAGKKDERVLDSVKHEVRKYVAREQRKPLPEGFDRWEFNCEVGADEISAQTTRPSDVIPAIETVAKTGAPQVFVEILAYPGKRPPRPQDGAAPASGNSPA